MSTDNRYQSAPNRLRGSIPIYHRYTLGVAGDRFFKSTRDHKLILASKCSNCHTRFLLPKIYCEICFQGTDDWSPVEGPGYVKSYTKVCLSLENESSKDPDLIAIIGWHGVRGGILHRLDSNEFNNVKIGSPVEPVWAKIRGGNINDIESFRLRSTSTKT